MKNLIYLSFLSMLMFVGCRKNELPQSIGKAGQPSEIQAAKAKLVELIRQHHPISRIDLGLEPISKDLVKNRAAGIKSLRLNSNEDFNFYRQMVKDAINAEDYECEPTIINEYVNNSIQSWTDFEFTIYYYFGFIPFDYAYVFANTAGGEYYGRTGQFTNAINRNFKDLKSFWNIPNDILLKDAHGSIYNDIPKVTQVLMLYSQLGILWPMTEDEAEELAGFLQTAFGSPQFMYFNHPLLTFNAFAAMEDPFFNTPKKVVMGDGIMQAYADLGFGDVAPQAILAHEYGHHVQYAKNVAFGPNPEDTRRTELMADALASYFLTHKRGAAMNWKRVQEFLQVFYAIGDCQFDNPGHHGTPNQRMRASIFGYTIASDAQKQGKILSAEEFITLFDAALADMIAPDAY